VGNVSRFARGRKGNLRLEINRGQSGSPEDRETAFKWVKKTDYVLSHTVRIFAQKERRGRERRER